MNRQNRSLAARVGGFILDILTLRSPQGRLSLLAGISLFLLLVPYESLSRFSLSLFDRLHIPSPSIGLTRAYWRVLHGDITGAWDRNPLIFIVLAIVLYLVILDIQVLLRKRRTKRLVSS